MSLGLPDVTLNTLRHTFATHCELAGVPRAVVATWMGHSSLRTLDIYSHYRYQYDPRVNFTRERVEQCAAQRPQSGS